MTMFSAVRATAGVAVLFAVCSTQGLYAQGAGGSGGSVEARRAALTKLLAEQWEYQLKESPELATIIGDYRYNDKLSDGSLKHLRESVEKDKEWIARFEAIDTAEFPEQEALNKTLMVRNLKEGQEVYALKVWEMPVNQMSGIHSEMAQFVQLAPFTTTKQYEDFIARLRLVPKVFEDTIAICEVGRKDKLMPPKFLLEKVPGQARAIGTPAGDANVFAMPFKKFPASVPAADQKRLHDAAIAVIDKQVRPAYAKYADYIEKTYAPAGRTQEGIWALNNGDALYRYSIKSSTTTSMDPEAIHELGMSEVKRIEAEQTAIALKLGAKDLASFRESLKTNPKAFPTSAEDLLEHYRGYIAQMKLKLPELFGLQPKAPVIVVAMEAFRDKEGAAADYNTGTPDGSRPGRVNINTYDWQHRSLLTVESTAYHEGIPGHHMQLSVAQELPTLPPFRQQGGYTAYVEGWALYSERLGKEVGFYQDPLSDFGRLNDELLRACRLVLDTGVHYKHWTRQQMVDFFHQHSGEDEADVQAETDRYIAWPGQALAYKIGQLKISELRERAKTQLGDKYDVRKYHDEILNGGALPLDVMDTRVQAWIDSQK
jgi:uncharacterized protein (DUF885 family)